MIDSYFEWFKVLHITFVIAWMVGLLYLPRIYSYHVTAKQGSDMDSTFKVMEKRVLRIIMNPSAIISIIMGMFLAYIYGLHGLGGWFHMKLFLVCVMLVIHMMLAKYRKDFEVNENKKTKLFYKLLSEFVFFVMFIIIILVIIKPFDD